MMGVLPQTRVNGVGRHNKLKFLVASGAFLIVEQQRVSSPGAVSIKRYSTSSSSERVNY